MYLMDDEGIAKAQARVAQDKHDVGFLSWRQLAAIQLRHVTDLAVTAEIRAFLRGAIHRAYVERSIQPAELPLPYLDEEPSFEDVLDKRASPLGSEDWPRALWALSSP
jgi:hypothetical protein